MVSRSVNIGLVDSHYGLDGVFNSIGIVPVEYETMTGDDAKSGGAMYALNDVLWHAAEWIRAAITIYLVVMIPLTGIFVVFQNTIEPLMVGYRVGGYMIASWAAIELLGVLLFAQTGHDGGRL